VGQLEMDCYYGSNTLEEQESEQKNSAGGGQGRGNGSSQDAEQAAGRYGGGG
jgi:hypothetical protein